MAPRKIFNVKAVQEKRYHSLDLGPFTYDQLKELRERFAKRHFSLMMVSFGSSKGSPSCDKNLLHASDIKLFFKDGKVYSHGRGLAKPVTQVLFSQHERQQLTMF